MKEVTIVSFILLVNLFCLIATRPHNQQNSETNSVNYLQRLSPSEEFSDIKHVGGLDVDGNDNLVIFHRGSRKWTFDSFIGNEFNTKAYGPIEEDVISVINPNTYETILTTGSGRFYMPHGIHIDYDGNIWLTDVGLHQVFKFNPKNLEKPELTLGTKLESGSGVDHFCKPTGVAVSRTTGDIFISDGYCNRRIVQFDKDGKFVQEIVDKEQPLNLVHSVTLVESLNLVCAASREDGRIVCFDMISGDKKRTIKNPHMNTVYAVKFDPVNEVLHAVTGENRGEFATGITFDATATYFGKQIEIWKPKKITLDEAHDLTISLDGSKIYTGQLNGEIDEFEFERKTTDDIRE